MKGTYKTIDEYLAGVPANQRAALERLRQTIRGIAPKAEECISYQIPMFKLHGKMLVGFGAAAKHCAFYPGGIVDEFKDELQKFGTSKGTIRFQPEKPLPTSLIRKIVKARIEQNAARLAEKSKTR